jgi:hypothetical protein
MGREIRRVPKDWQHPVDENGQYIPLYDQDYESVAAQWLDDCRCWEDGTHGDLEGRPELKQEYPHWWDWEGPPPEKEQYRAVFADAPCYQIYETVSEGTPVSPVFDAPPELVEWLVSQEYSRTAAENFVNEKWAPSFVMANGKLWNNIESCAILQMKGQSNE